MLKEDFWRGFDLLCHRYSKRSNENLASVYYDRLRKIPNEAWQDIVQAIIDDEKFFPTPGQLKRAWLDWLKDHPLKQRKRVEYPCEYCCGEGCLHFKVLQESPVAGMTEMEYHYVCRCGYCENWKEHGFSEDLPRWTVENLEYYNLTWVVAGRPVTEDHPWPPRLQKQIDQVGEHIKQIGYEVE